jgi:sulfite exporter TauE/SafE
MAYDQMKEDNFEIKIVKYILIGLGALVIFVIYFLLQKSGALQIFSRFGESNLSYGLLFAAGLLASFHCVGMCGGFVVTYTVEHDSQSTQKRKILPHIYYNFGRIISYTAVGAILGGIGSFFGINPIFSGALTLFVSVFMIALGLSLIKKINFVEIIKSKMPSTIAKFLFSQKYATKPKGPFIIGLLNGFMPCGPLQAVQFYALGTGSAIAGALSMFFFVLGTIF